MQFLTRAEYAELKDISRQAVGQRIKRGTLKTVLVDQRVERIPVDDTEIEAVNS